MRTTIVTAAALAALAACSKEDPGVGGTAKDGGTVVYRDPATRRILTTKDLSSVPPAIKWEQIGAQAVPAETHKLVDEAEEAFFADQLEKAINLLERAHGIAPEWPEPLHRVASYLLYKGELDRAHEFYERVDRIAPRGYANTKTVLDSLRREIAGVIGRGAYNGLPSPDAAGGKPKARETLQKTVKQWPRFPAAWVRLQALIDDDTARLEAIENGLKQNPDADSKGTLLVNKAIIVNKRGQRDEAIRILGELAVDPASTLGTEHLAKVTLRDLLGIK